MKNIVKILKEEGLPHYRILPICFKSFIGDPELDKIDAESLLHVSTKISLRNDILSLTSFTLDNDNFPINENKEYAPKKF